MGARDAKYDLQGTPQFSPRGGEKVTNLRKHQRAKGHRLEKSDLQGYTDDWDTIAFCAKTVYVDVKVCCGSNAAQEVKDTCFSCVSNKAVLSHQSDPVAPIIERPPEGLNSSVAKASPRACSRKDDIESPKAPKSKFCKTDLAPDEALMWACAREDIPRAKAALELGANVEACDQKGYRALQFACANGCRELVKLLLSRHNAELLDADRLKECQIHKSSSTLSKSQTICPLYLAMVRGDVDICKLLVLDYSALDREGMPLLWESWNEILPPIAYGNIDTSDPAQAIPVPLLPDTGQNDPLSWKYPKPKDINIGDFRILRRHMREWLETYLTEREEKRLHDEARQRRLEEEERQLAEAMGEAVPQAKPGGRRRSSLVQAIQGGVSLTRRASQLIMAKAGQFAQRLSNKTPDNRRGAAPFLGWRRSVSTADGPKKKKGEKQEKEKRQTIVTGVQAQKFFDDGNNFT